MLSCFPFSYSPLKDDDYAQLFIGPEDQLAEEANDNCLNINLSSVDSEALIKQTTTTTTTDNLLNLVNNTDTSLLRSALSQSSQSSSLPSHPLSSSPVSNRDNIKLPVPLPRTFRKPDTIFNVDSCHTINSTPITTTNTNSITNSTKSSLLKLGFHRSKGTEHLQQEALRKSNEPNSLVLHSQRYIKLPTSSVSKFCESSNNNKSSNNNNNNINNTHKSKSNTSLSNKTIISGQNRLTSHTPIPKPPSKSLGLSTSSAPSCSLSGSPKLTPKLSPKPPPRPLTSHPGLGSGTNIMPRQKVQFASVNTSDTLTGLDRNNVSSNTTGETSLAANGSASASACSPTRDGSQSASVASSMPSTSSSNTCSTTSDWSKAGSFINKPPRGWLHPDQQIAETGISYAVRYVGCLAINTSMKSLDFDTRSQIAKECINRVCESGGLKTPDKKRRPEKRITRMLAENPNMDCAGADVNLTITSSYLNLAVMETGENIAKHEMPNISFASGGDADTLDFVAYVAKDHRYGRACFVLECGGGLAQDVITTIGQAFELRFKEFLKRTPRNTPVNERLDTTLQNGSNSNPNKENNSGRLEDREYYNDLPGKMPPDVPLNENHDKTLLKESVTLQKVLPQAAPRSCLKKSSLTSSEQCSPNLIDLSTDIQDEDSDIKALEAVDIISQETNRLEPEYVNCTTDDSNNNHSSNDSTLKPLTQSTIKDPFDMQPFNSALAQVTNDPLLSSEITSVAQFSGKKSSISSVSLQLEKEEWFHGPISRKDSENLVVKDGDFLVRESQGSAGQYVLTGMQGGTRKHLLLVDPEGVVRTKDKTFESVSHLINYHRNNGLPIISAESALVLRNPVLAKR